MKRTRLLPLVIALATPLAAQDVAFRPESAEELVEVERIRAEVAAILEEYTAPAESGTARVARANTLVDRLATRTLDYAPFIAEEADRDLRVTFDFCAFALGRMDSEVAEAALLRAVSRADQELGDAAAERKTMALWGLGLQGDVGALDLIEEGRHKVGSRSVHNQTSLLESVAYHTSPESIARLYELADLYLNDEERVRRVMDVLGALRRIAAPETVPRLTKLAKHPNGMVRREASRALAAIGTPEALKTLSAGLNDELLGVRRVVAMSLEKYATADTIDAMVARLETDDDWLTRGYLYRAIARALGPKAWPRLEPYWGHEDPRERRALVQAVGRIPNPTVLPRLREALADPDAAVGINAATALGEIGGRAAVEAMAAVIPDADPLVLRALVKRLTALHGRAAGPALEERLFETFLNEVIVKPNQRSVAERLVDGLVGVRHTSAAPRLRRAAEKQTDRSLVTSLESAARKLETLETLGSDVGKWADVCGDEEPEMRRLAYSRLGEIGTKRALDALVAAFDSADDKDRVIVMQSIHRADSPRVAALLERVLTSPDFDPVDNRRLREHAAWAARRIGGSRMYDLLRSAVERRRGRDARITAYAALTGGASALPLLEAHRLSQLGYFGWKRGEHQEALDRLAREIAAGRPLYDFDVPPERSLIP